MPLPYVQRVPPLLIAHRGFRTGLGDNTIAQIEAAIELGCDVVEIDVRRNSGGRLVLAHDKEHRDGAASLTDALALCAERRMPLNLDLKHNGIADQVASEIRAVGCSELVTITGGGWEQSLWVRRLEPQIRVGLTVPRWHGLAARAAEWSATNLRHRFFTPRLDLLMRAYRVDLICLQYRLATARVVDLIHQAGGQVWCWTPDRPDAIATLIDYGVDGICTNAPWPAEVLQRG